MNNSLCEKLTILMRMGFAETVWILVEHKNQTYKQWMGKHY